MAKKKLKDLSIDEWADYLKKNGTNGKSSYSALVIHPKLRNQLGEAYSDKALFNMLGISNPNAEWIKSVDNERLRLNNIGSSPRDYWHHLHLGKGAPSGAVDTHKAYFTMKDLSKISAKDFEDFALKMQYAGVNGQFKAARELKNAVSRHEHFVFHGLTKDDVDLAESLAKGFFGEKLEAVGRGIDSGGSSFNQIKSLEIKETPYKSTKAKKKLNSNAKAKNAKKVVFQNNTSSKVDYSVPIKERLNNYKNSKTVKVGPKQTNAAYDHKELFNLLNDGEGYSKQMLLDAVQHSDNSFFLNKLSDAPVAKVMAVSSSSYTPRSLWNAYQIGALSQDGSTINLPADEFHSKARRVRERVRDVVHDKPIYDSIFLDPDLYDDDYSKSNAGARERLLKEQSKPHSTSSTNGRKAITGKVEPTTHTLDLNYSVNGAGTRVNSRGKLGGSRKAGNNIKSRTKAGVGTSIETGNRLLPAVEVSENIVVGANKTVATNASEIVNDVTKKPAAAASKAGKQKHIYTVFDFETNGKIKGNGVDKVMPEVLSYSAQKYELDLLTGESKPMGSMQGYYQPKDGNFNAGAQRVHGLDQAKIEAARTDKNYGATFEDDKAKLIEFMNKDSDAIVAHNLNEFDGNYFVGQLDEEITKIDTYTVAKDARLETNVLQYLDADNGDIHTKSNSSVYHYYENKMPEGDLHDAVNDVKTTAKNYHNMVLDEKTGLAHNLGLDKTNVKEFNRAKSDHYYRITVGKNGEKITTKMSTKTNQPLTVEGEVADALKRKEKAMAGVTKKDIVENAKATTRKFGDTMREFGTAAKKFSDDFSKLSTGKKAGRIAGATAIVGGGALLVKTAKDRRKAEQEKLKSITASVEKNRSGGF